MLKTYILNFRKNFTILQKYAIIHINKEANNMHDLELEFDFCKKYMLDMNIKIAPDENISIAADDNTDGYAGLCRQDDKIYKISIKKAMLNDQMPIEFLRDVIMHELLHTRPRSMSHGKNFLKTGKEIQKKSNDKYRIIIGIDNEYIENPDIGIAAVYECECGFVQYMTKDGENLKSLMDDKKRYFCPYCKAKMTKNHIKNPGRC